MIFFKFSGGLHYALTPALGEKFLPVWLMGMIISVAALCQMIFDIPMGKILDKYGYRKLLIIGTATFTLAGALWYFRVDALFIIISTVIAIVGWLISGPGVNAYVLSHADTNNSGIFMGYRDAAYSIGIILSTIALPFLVNAPHQIIGIVLGGIMLIATVFIAISPRDTKKLTVDDHPSYPRHHQRKFIVSHLAEVIRKLNPASMLLVCTNFAGSIFYGVIRFVIPLMMAQNPSQSTILGIGMGMFDFAILITGTLLCTIVDKGNKKRMILRGFLLFAVMGMMLGIQFGYLFLVFAFLASVGDELSGLPLRAWLHQLDTEHTGDGILSGILNFFEDLGRTV